jgi:hypothetical protein
MLACSTTESACISGQQHWGWAARFENAGHSMLTCGKASHVGQCIRIRMSSKQNAAVHNTWVQQATPPSLYPSIALRRSPQCEAELAATAVLAAVGHAQLTRSQSCVSTTPQLLLATDYSPPHCIAAPSVKESWLQLLFLPLLLMLNSRSQSLGLHRPL